MRIVALPFIARSDNKHSSAADYSCEHRGKTHIASVRIKGRTADVEAGAISVKGGVDKRMGGNSRIQGLQNLGSFSRHKAPGVGGSKQRLKSACGGSGHKASVEF